MVDGRSLCRVPDTSKDTSPEEKSLGLMGLTAEEVIDFFEGVFELVASLEENGKFEPGFGVGWVGLFCELEGVESFVRTVAHAEALSGEEECLMILFSGNFEEMPIELEGLVEFVTLTVGASGIGEGENVVGLLFDSFFKKAEAFWEVLPDESSARLFQLRSVLIDGLAPRIHRWAVLSFVGARDQLRGEIKTASGDP